MKLKNKLFSVAAAGMLVFSNVTTAVVSANELTTMSEETQKAIYSSQPGTRAVQTYSDNAQSTSARTASATISTASVSNVVDAKDTVLVKGLTAKDVVRIYDSKGTEIGKGTAKGDSLTITLKNDLGATSGTVQVSRQEYDATQKKLLTESSKTTVNFAKPPVTTNATAIKVVNNTKSKDYIELNVTDVEDKAVITIYDSSASTAKAIGKYTHKAGNGTKATVNVKLDDNKNKLYFSTKVKGKLESDKTEKDYTLPEQSSVTSGSKAVNNLKSKDTITVTNVAVGDLIEVYASTEETAKPIGKATAKAPKNSSETTVDVTVSLSFTGKDKNEYKNVYVTRTSPEKRRSTAETVSVPAIATSTTVKTSEATLIVNENSKSEDKAKGGLFVTELNPEDEVLVYNTSAITADVKPIGKGKAGKEEEQTYIKLSNGLTNATTELYVVKQSKDKNPSSPVAIQVSGGFGKQ